MRAYEWTASELRQAIGLLPNTWFSGKPQFDRIGERVTGRPTLGISLKNALEAAGLIVSFCVNEAGVEDRSGTYLRYRKT